MAIAMTVSSFLEQEGVDYDIVSHTHTASSAETAQAAHIPREQLAKSVILEDESGYIMAVLPATHRLKIGELNKLVQRKLGLATEPELGHLFADCDVGAVPAVGQAYKIETVWDETLGQMPDIYFEGGDHEQLVHMSGSQFRVLMHNTRHGRFSAGP